MGVILIIAGHKIQEPKESHKEKKIQIEEMTYDNEKKTLEKNLKIKSNTGEEFNVSLKVKTSVNDNCDNHYEVSREYTGKSEDGSYAYKYTNSNGETGTGWTSESPERYKKRKIKERIDKEVSKVTIKYKGVE